jgi:hypothetical protein
MAMCYRNGYMKKFNSHESLWLWCKGLHQEEYYLLYLCTKVGHIAILLTDSVGIHVAINKFYKRKGTRNICHISKPRVNLCMLNSTDTIIWPADVCISVVVRCMQENRLSGFTSFSIMYLVFTEGGGTDSQCYFINFCVSLQSTLLLIMLHCFECVRN